MRSLFEYILRTIIILFLRKDVKAMIPSKIDLKTTFEGKNIISRNVLLRKCKIGLGTYISKDCEFISTKIGRFCSIGPRVKTVHGSHPTSVFVSTHQAFYSIEKQAGFTFVTKNKFQERKTVLNDYSIVIGNDTWIGSDVTLIEGISISNGAIIASGSVVHRDVEPYEIVGGVPIKTVKYRFSEEVINRLKVINWWNWDINEIKRKHNDFLDIEDFMNQNQHEVKDL